ncbi:MAG: YihY/virulence factor BrkB family protein [Dehalococcoidia bacterium]
MTAQRLITVAGVLKGAVNEFLTDNCPHLSAAISYYFLLCLFPLALAAISVFGFIATSAEVEHNVTQAISDFVPVSADFIQRTIHGVAGNWGAAGIAATVGLVWGGMAVFSAIRKALNAAWGIKEPRPFLHERFLEFSMMLGLGLLMIMSLGLTTAFKFIQGADIAVFGNLIRDGGPFWQLIFMLSSAFLSFLAFFFLYKVVPNTRVRWRHAFFGALVAAVLFELVKALFIWFVGRFATYNLVYGSVGTIVALMTWTYVSAVIMLFCAKMTSIYPRVRASLAAQAAGADLKDHNPRVRIPSISSIPSPSMILVNMAVLTSGSLGRFRRMRSGKG